jgi:hypothetical protein
MQLFSLSVSVFLIQINSYRNHRLLSKSLFQIQLSLGPEQTDASSANYFISEKNRILFEKLKRTVNLTATANECVNFCDESFDDYLQNKISSQEGEEEQQKLGFRSLIKLI